MVRARDERGFTLLETAIVVGIVAVVVGALGVRALAGPSVAVAAAASGVGAAFEEARRTATAFDAATVVFATRPAGSGFSVRIYRRIPGDSGFAPANGPAYEGEVKAEETAAPLGAPGFAFSIDHRGNVVGFANFVPAAASFDQRACPAGGAYAIGLRSGPQQRTVAVPCTLALAGTTPVVFETAPPAATPPPAPTPALACAPPGSCPLPPLPAAKPAYILNINPASLTVTANGAFAFTATDVATTGPPGNVAIASTQGNCDSWSVAAGTWAPSGTSFGGIGRAGACTIAVTDTAGNSATVAVTVTGPPHAQVDDQCNVAYGTFVYTDTTTAPPTDHLGNGQPCAAPTPTAAPTPPAIVEADEIVAYVCADQSSCRQVDSAAEYLLADGNAASTVSPAQANAFAAEIAAHACSFPAPAAGGQFVGGVDYPDNAYATLYQEANDNGVGGYVAVTVTVCPP